MTVIFDATRPRVKSNKSRRSFGTGITPRRTRKAAQSVVVEPTPTPIVEQPPVLHYGLHHGQYIEVCRQVNSARLALYAEYAARYGPGVWPTVGEVQERCERERERLIELFRAKNENRPMGRGGWSVEKGEGDEDQPMTDAEIRQLFERSDATYEQWAAEVVDGFTGHPTWEI